MKLAEEERNTRVETKRERETPRRKYKSVSGALQKKGKKLFKNAAISNSRILNSCALI